MATVKVSKTTTLEVGTTNDITLNNAGNDFATLAITTAKNATINDLNDLKLCGERCCPQPDRDCQRSDFGNGVN